MLPVAILAGGLATRLRPLTETVPKALIDVGGEPFIARQLRLLRTEGVERVVLCLGYLGEMIQEFLASVEDGPRVDFSFDGPRLLGSAGALKKAAPLLGEVFFVMYGDSYLPCDYHAVQAAYEDSGQAALMTVFCNEDRWERSNVEFNEGVVIAYDKNNPKPGMRFIDYGLGVLHESALEAVPDNQWYDLASIYQQLLQEGQLAAHEVFQRFYEIGSVSGLEETREYFASQSSS